MPFRKSYRRGGFKKSYGGVKKGYRSKRSAPKAKSAYTGRSKEEIKLSRLAAIAKDPQLQAQIGLVTGSLQDDRIASLAGAFLELLDRGLALLEGGGQPLEEEQPPSPAGSSDQQQPQQSEEDKTTLADHSSEEQSDSQNTQETQSCEEQK